jgi:hypothetical protein
MRSAHGNNNMKRILICLMLAGWTLCATFSYAEQNINTQQAEIKQLEGTIQLLKDEQLTQDMLKQLNALLEAKKELLQQERKTQKPGAGVDFVAVFSRYQALFSSKVRGLGEKLGALASDYNKPIILLLKAMYHECWI